MQLNPKIVEALSHDKASGHSLKTVVMPDVDLDVVYITNSAWTLVLTRPEDHVDPALLEWLREQQKTYKGRGKYVDWRALVADAVDVEAGKFLPPKSPYYVDLLTEPYGDFYVSRTPEKVRTLVEGHNALLHGDSTNLTAMFRAGEGRPVYAEKTDNKPWTGRTVETFWFRFNGRVAAIQASWISALDELGFDVLCLNDSEGKPPEAFGLLHREDADLFGFVKVDRHSGQKADGKGRNIFGDASRLSWVDADAALTMLGHMDAHPLQGLPETLWEHPDVLEGKETPTTRAVGVLRWRGWSDADINAAYLHGRPTALDQHYRRVMAEASRIRKELAGSTMNSWWLSSLEGKLKVVCQDVEQLEKLAGKEIPLGDLPDAITLLERKKTA